MNVSVVVASPEVSLVARLNESRRNSQAVSFAAHAAFKDVGGAQGAAYARDVLITFLEGHRRSARDDSEALRLQPPEARNHLLGQAVAEIILLRVAAQILERQHGQYDFPGWRNRFLLPALPNDITRQRHDHSERGDQENSRSGLSAGDRRRDC